MKEETGTVEKGLEEGVGIFYSVELGMQTLCLVSTRRRDWKPKGNCWLCVEICLTIIHNFSVLRLVKLSMILLQY